MNVNKKLIEQCKRGNQLKQKELYFMLLPYLRAVCSRYLRNTDLIKDVLQESFIDIFKNLEKYDSQKGAFHKWAVRITINATLKYNQRVNLGKQEEFLVDKHDIIQPSQALEKISDETLLNILKQMPKGNFEVFNLYVIDGYSHKEIARILNISESLSRKKLSRAKSWLQHFLQNKTNYIAGVILSQLSLN